ncbi:glycine cleavage system protein GcvH [Streptomyces goshikiensis]|uniref:glycine cleavage system protein GcvH n=1 Tax=Streptomyces goshikiensis TaxID=1942 RepID=UPI0036A25587
MPNVPDVLRYTADHEWIQTEDSGVLVVGITDHAQSALGDVVFVELPTVGTQASEGDVVAVLESTKAASDVYTPIAGEVVEVNTSVAETPEALNSDPYGSWLFKIRPTASTEGSKWMSPEQYVQLTQ